MILRRLVCSQTRGQRQNGTTRGSARQGASCLGSSYHDVCGKRVSANLIFSENAACSVHGHCEHQRSTVTHPCAAAMCCTAQMNPLLHAGVLHISRRGLPRSQEGTQVRLMPFMPQQYPHTRFSRHATPSHSACASPNIRSFVVYLGHCSVVNR